MGYRIAFLFIVVCGTCAPAQGQSSHRALREGDKAYREGNFEEAERAYGDAIRDENSAKGNYNLGNALYERGNFEEAAKRYEEAAGLSDDPGIRARAFRNLGDSYYRQENYQQAVESYKQSLRLNPDDPDTKYNLTKAIRQVQQQQEQQQDENQQQDGEDQEQDEQQQEGQGGENGDQQQQDGEQSEEGDEAQEQDAPAGGTPGQPDADPNQPQMSREEAERQLGIAAEEEKRTLSRLRQASREGCTGTKDW